MDNDTRQRIRAILAHEEAFESCVDNPAAVLWAAKELFAENELLRSGGAALVARARGRAEAFEEAADVCRGLASSGGPGNSWCLDCAETIEAHAVENPEKVD